MTNVHSLKTATLRRRLQALIADGVTIQKIAVESGALKKDLEAWLEDKDSPAVEARLQEWVEELDGISERAVGWVETPTTTEITEAIEFARTEPSISIVYGAPGIGKTMTAERYAAERRDGADRRSGRCIYVMASEF